MTLAQNQAQFDLPPLSTSQQSTIIGFCHSPADALARTGAYAGSDFDRRHPPPGKAGTVEIEKKLVTVDETETSRLTGMRTSIDPLRKEATATKAFSRSFAAQLGLVAMLGFIIADPAGLIYVAASYVAGSPVFDIYAGNIQAALPFSAFVIAGLVGTKALGLLPTSDDGRRLFTRVVLGIGLACFSVAMVGFGMLFNPAGLQSNSLENVGTEALTTAASGSGAIAAILVMAKLLGGSLIAGGTWLVFEQRADANKVMHAEPKADYTAFTALREANHGGVLARQARIETMLGEEQRHAANRAAFVHACEAFCLSCLAQVDAATAQARVETLSELQSAHLPASIVPTSGSAPIPPAMH